MKKASIAEMKTHFSTYLKAAQQEPVIITRKGKPVALLSAIEDEEELERLLMANSPKLQAILDAAQKRFDAGEGIPEEQFWEEVASEQATKKRSTRRRKTA